MNYKFGKVERLTTYGEVKTTSTFEMGGQWKSIDLRARPLRDGQVELSLDQYGRKATAKRSTRNYVSIVLSDEQAEALAEMLATRKGGRQ